MLARAGGMRPLATGIESRLLALDAGLLPTLPTLSTDQVPDERLLETLIKLPVSSSLEESSPPRRPRPDPKECCKLASVLVCHPLLVPDP